jgi:uncharacterized protein YbjT (DUF2867 family)
MNILVVGASGATGRLPTEELLNRGQFEQENEQQPA